MADVAILGTGRMGAALAERLAGAGAQVVVWSRDADRAAAAAAAAGDSVRVAPEPDEAVAAAPVVVSFLADGAATCEVLLNSAVLAAFRPDQLVADLGTSGVEATRRLGHEFARRGLHFVDAPVSGSVPTVRAGELLVMAGGADADVSRLGPVLAPAAARILHVGPVGAGQAVKLAVNLVVHSTNAALSEGLALAVAAGVDAATCYEVFVNSVVSSPFLRYKRPAFLDRVAPVAMSLDLVEKDLRLVGALAEEVGVVHPMTTAVRRTVAAACADGLGGDDMAALFGYVQNAPTG
jgi:3-hydroxyisobutyrate dehydrogenase